MMVRIALLTAALSGAILTTGAAQAQQPTSPSIAPPPSMGSMRLRDAVSRLTRDPRDATALAEAGEASLALGDSNAARGYFERASVLRPSDGRIKAGLASALLREENPFEALRLFDEAVKLGAPVSAIAADRGLAFDLLGNSDRAIADYRLAAGGNPNDALAIRMATSLGLAGRVAEADALLSPLMTRQLPAAWRARAMYLAAAGRTDEAYRIVQGFMDPGTAQSFRPFLERMQRLTRAQQAAAAQLGHFPRADDIGRDSEQIRTAALASGVVPGAQRGDSNKLIPAGAPLGAASGKAAPVKKLSKRKLRRQAEAARLAQEEAARLAAAEADRRAKAEALALAERDRLAAEAEARRLAAAQVEANRLAAEARIREERRIADARAEEQRLAAARLAAAAATPPANSTTVAASATDQPVQLASLAAGAERAPLSTTPASTAVAGPTFDGRPIEAAPAQALRTPEAAPASGTAPAIVARPSLIDIVGAIEVPEEELRRRVAPVDLSRIKRLPVVDPDVPMGKDGKPLSARAIKALADKAALDAKGAKKPKVDPQPARIWVQVATGSNVNALAFDWRKLGKESPKTYGKRDAWSSPWGRTRRLVVGPFATLKEAKAFEAEQKKAGGDGFVWQSEKGVVVEPLPGS